MKLARYNWFSIMTPFQFGMLPEFKTWFKISALEEFRDIELIAFLGYAVPKFCEQLLNFLFFLVYE